MSLVKDGYSIKRRREEGSGIKSYYYRTTRRIYYQPACTQKDLEKHPKLCSSDSFDKKQVKQRVIRKTEQVEGFEGRNIGSFRIFRSSVSTYDLATANNGDNKNNNNKKKNLYLEPLTDYENDKKIANWNQKKLLPYKGNQENDYRPHVEYYDKILAKPKRRTDLNELNNQEYVNLSDDNFNVYNRNLARNEIKNKTAQLRQNEDFYKNIMSSTNLNNLQIYPVQRSSDVHTQEIPRIDENFYENFPIPEMCGDKSCGIKRLKSAPACDAKPNLSTKPINPLVIVTEPVQLRPKKTPLTLLNNTGRSHTYYDTWLSLKE